ncbi:hypothetical protein DSB67_00720 [Vibrio campbellii]|uniref:hypothetical protein n=1 Tax=Vibrio campbellii TaxID=680 RepID=UPI00026C4BFA|nr:hypothetical protein [Vibrio campbellii]AXB30199.1 hypothetical protein DSB67_00720 [Vibrio campbellii]
MKKSEVIVDLSKIAERLEDILSADTINSEVKLELKQIHSSVESVYSELKTGCISFSITARAKPQSEKCRFCGR